MNDLTITATSSTPEINFLNTGEFYVGGISTPENVVKFYQPVFDWLNDFEKTSPNSIVLTLQIDYLNTSSTRIMVELFSLLNTFKQKSTDVKFIWKYEVDDDDLLELGEDLQISSKSTFEFLAYNPD